MRDKTFAVESMLFPKSSIGNLNKSVWIPAFAVMTKRAGLTACLMSVVVCLMSFSAVYALAQVPQTQSKTAQEQVDEEDLSLDPYTWDFGNVSPEDVLQHTFILTNESSVVLNIKQVNTSCGCTASEVKKKQLQPGESTDINVTFKAKGYKGAVQQFVYVNTDSLDNPVIRYIIKANVVK